MATEIVKCRAKTSADCYDGTEGYYPEDVHWTEDGTFDGESVVCDACYVALIPRTTSGRGLNHELDAAIAAAPPHP